VATVEVRFLTLKGCGLEDGGAALVELVRQGRGPNELCFDCNIFDSSEKLVAFMNALRSNTYLERLMFIRGRLVTPALAAALQENKGLIFISVIYLLALDASGRTEILEALFLGILHCVLST
jgi:hypothetical protein